MEVTKIPERLECALAIVIKLEVQKEARKGKQVKRKQFYFMLPSIGGATWMKMKSRSALVPGGPRGEERVTEPVVRPRKNERRGPGTGPTSFFRESLWVPHYVDIKGNPSLETVSLTHWHSLWTATCVLPPTSLENPLFSSCCTGSSAPLFVAVRASSLDIAVIWWSLSGQWFFGAGEERA